MKRFVSVILLVVLAVSLFSCSTGGSNDTVDKIAELYSRSIPTKTVTTITSDYSGKMYTDKITLVRGKIDGALDAARLTEYTERPATIEAGSGAEILPEVTKKTVVTEYLEGKGTRVDGKAWDSTGKNFAPTAGSIALNITSSKVTGVYEKDNVIGFTVEAANTESVLGVKIDSDVTVKITHDGASVVGIVIKYTQAADAANFVPESKVVIDIVYTYDIEKITIE